MDYGNGYVWRQGSALLMATIAMCCTGCWEEIHYEPQPQPPPTSQSPPTSQPPALPGGIESEQPSKSQEQTPPASDSPTPSDPTPSDPTRSELSQNNSEQSSPTGSDPLAKPGAEMRAPEVPTTEPDASLPNTKLQAWRLGSYWSLAAAYYAKDASAESLQPRLQQAISAAEQLQIEVPELPEVIATDDRVATIVAYLHDQGPLLAKQIDQKFDSQHAALLQLAAKSYALLLVYSPRNKKRMPLVDQVEQSAHASGLPETVWRELVDLLRQRAPYLEVKLAVFTLHKQVEVNLSNRD